MKRIESPSKRWPGHVLLHDPLNYGMVKALDDAQDKQVDLKPSSLLSERDEGGKITKELVWAADNDYLRIEAILKCVAEWHLGDFPEQPTLETFPMSPRKERQNLVSWLWDEINKIYEGEIEVPNES